MPHNLTMEYFQIPPASSPMRGLGAHTSKKLGNYLSLPSPRHFRRQGGLGARTSKKKGISFSKIGVRKIRSIITNKGTWVLHFWENLKENIIKIWVCKIYAINFWKVVKPLSNKIIAIKENCNSSTRFNFSFVDKQDIKILKEIKNLKANKATQNIDIPSKLIMKIWTSLRILFLKIWMIIVFLNQFSRQHCNWQI